MRPKRLVAVISTSTHFHSRVSLHHVAEMCNFLQAGFLSGYSNTPNRLTVTGSWSLKSSVSVDFPVLFPDDHLSYSHVSNC